MNDEQHISGGVRSRGEQGGATTAVEGAAALREENERLRALVEQMRREAELNEDGAAEVLDDTRRSLLRCFPEMDRLGIAMLYKDAHGREWNVPALAQHVATRLEAAHAYKDGKQPSATVAERLEELRRDRDAWKIRAMPLLGEDANAREQRRAAVLAVCNRVRDTARACYAQPINTPAFAEEIMALFGIPHCTADAPCGACRDCAGWVE